MRYFFISFSTPFGFGNLGVARSNMPDNNEIKLEASKQRHTSMDGIVVLNIFEFLSQEDFERFWNIQ